MDKRNGLDEPYRFSTDELPERDRLEFWIEQFGRELLKLDFRLYGDSSLSAAGAMRTLPGLAILKGRASPVRTLRTSRLVAEGADDMMLHINCGGLNHFKQFGREAHFESGEAVLVSGADPAVGDTPFEHQYIDVCIPRSALAGRLPGPPEDLCMRPIRKGSETLQLLLGYLSLLYPANAESGLRDPVLAESFASHVIDLCALALSPTWDVLHQSDAGVAAARLSAIRADIRAHLNEEGLSAETVAARHGIGARQLQRLFERQGATFSEFLLSERLNHAQRLLTDPRFSSWTVTAIAYKAGFADLSHFNRSFRRRFGKTPTEARKASGR